MAYWFNPLVWLGYVLLCRDLEMACDEAVIQSLELAGEEAKKTFVHRYHDSRRELRTHISFILKSTFFSRKERTTNVMLALGLYGIFRSVYHALKR